MDIIKQNLNIYMGKLYMIHSIILDYNGYYHNKDINELENLIDIINYNEKLWEKYSTNLNIERFKQNLFFIKKNIISLAKLNNLNINMIKHIGGSCYNFIKNKIFSKFTYKFYNNNIYIDNNSIYTNYGHFIIKTDELKYNIYNIYNKFLKIYKNIKIKRDMYYDNMTISLKLPYNVILYPKHSILKKYINEIIF